MVKCQSEVYIKGILKYAVIWVQIIKKTKINYVCGIKLFRMIKSYSIAYSIIMFLRYKQLIIYMIKKTIHYCPAAPNICKWKHVAKSKKFYTVIDYVYLSSKSWMHKYSWMHLTVIVLKVHVFSLLVGDSPERSFKHCVL